MSLLAVRQIVPDVKVQFVTADRHRPVVNQRLIGSTIRIRDRAGHDATCAEVRQLDNSTATPSAGLPLWVSSTWVDKRPYTPSRSSDTTSSATRSAAIRYISPIEFCISVAVSFVQAALEITQDGTLGVAARAYDVGKTKLGAVGAVDPLKCLEFGIRQPIESGAVLFGAGFGGEAGGTLCLICEIRMTPDESKPTLRCVWSTTVFIASNSLPHAGKRPCDSSVFGYPGRVFEDIAERRDELVPAASVQIGKKF